MYIAHAPISYLSNEIVQAKNLKKLKTEQQILVAIFSLILGILPDFDLFLSNIPGFMHHTFVTHTPFFYILIWIVLKILINPISRILNKRVSNFLDKNLLNILVNTFLIGTISHILADTFVSSIMLLYPLFHIKIHIFRYIFEPNLFSGYFLSTLFAIEMVFISLFLYLIYKNFFKKQKIAENFSKVLIILSGIYLLFSTFFSLSTYNRSYMYDNEGNISYDTDYDTLKDQDDMNIGNTKESNILKANNEDILDSTLDIVNSKKWSSYHKNSLIEKIKMVYGGFDSYSIVSQAYYNLHLPVEPVLKDFAIKENGFESYTKVYPYEQLLLEYLQKEDLLVELNLDSDPTLPHSKIFFLINSNNEIINLGITLEGNYIATVFENDTYLQMHSYKEVRTEYLESIEKIYIQK